jgi:hypothetical protein
VLSRGARRRRVRIGGEMEIGRLRRDDVGIVRRWIVVVGLDRGM